MAMGWEAWAVLVTLFGALGALYCEVAPPDQVMLAALVGVWHMGLVTTEQAFTGFSNSSLMTIGCLFIVARAVDRSKVVDRITRGLLGQKTSERGAVFRLCMTGMVLSGFLNNTPLVALLMPIVRDWARSRRFAASKFLLPLSYSTIMGGLTTMIGSSTNLVVNGLLQQSGHEPFSFFEPAFAAVPVGLVAMTYLVGVVPSLLPGDRGGLFRALREGQENMVTELELMPGFPLLGSCIFDALDELGIDRGALVKILRPAPVARRTPAPSWASPSISEEEASAAMGIHKPFTRHDSWGEDVPQEPFTLAAIFPVPDCEVACVGDVLVLSLSQEVLTDLVAKRPVGLQVKQMHALQLAGNDEFVELVIAPESALTGMQISRGAEAFKRLYGVALIAVRPRERVAPKIGESQKVAELPRGESLGSASSFRSGASSRGYRHSCSSPAEMRFSATSEKSFFSKGQSRELKPRAQSAQERMPLVSSQAIHNTQAGDDHQASDKHSRLEGRFGVGDVALVLAPKDAKLTRADFLLVTRIACMPAPISRRDLLPLIGFCVGLALTVCAGVSMFRVAMTLSVFCMLGGWVQPREVRDTVDWHLLILIGSALGLAQAVQTSGLSGQAALAVQAAGLPPSGALALLFLLVMMVTELVTNNAAAALGLPLAIDLAKELGLSSPRPFAMAVMLAASTSYACPIGYATNLMVLGPGGYTFGDFLRVGLFMDGIYWVGCSLVVPLIWPLV